MFACSIVAILLCTLIPNNRVFRGLCVVLTVITTDCLKLTVYMLYTDYNMHRTCGSDSVMYSNFQQVV